MFTGKNKFYLLLTFFFLFVLIIHYFQDETFGFMIADLSSAVVFFVLYKIKKVKIEMTISIALILWSLYMMFFYSDFDGTYAMALSYGTMNLFRYIKIDPIKVIIVISFLFCLNTVSIQLNNQHISSLGLNMLFVIMFSTGHYLLYHNEYKQPINLKRKYKLNDQHIKMLKLLVDGNENNQELASSMYVSMSTIISYYNTIYEALDIPKGGNRKVGLTIKLAKLGFI